MVQSGRRWLGWMAIACAGVLAGCGTQPATTSGHGAAAPSTGATACVSGQAANGSNATIPQEPTSGVASVSGKCWAKIAGTPITNAVLRSAPAGSSAEWKAAWTPTDLYVWCDVTTGRPVINTNTATPYEDDAVEVYLDASNNYAGAYGANTGQLLINSGGLTNSTLGTDHSLLSTEGAKAVEATGQTGYTVLLAEPWTDMHFQPAASAIIGFTIGVDFPGTGAVHRAGQTMWQGTVNNWDNDKGWGLLTLG